MLHTRLLSGKQAKFDFKNKRPWIAIDTSGKETVSLFLFFVNSLMIIVYTFNIILLAYWLGIFISQLITPPVS